VLKPNKPSHCYLVYLCCRVLCYLIKIQYLAVKKKPDKTVKKVPTDSSVFTSTSSNNYSKLIRTALNRTSLVSVLTQGAKIILDDAGFPFSFNTFRRLPNDTHTLFQHKAMVVASDGCYEYHMNHQDSLDFNSNHAALEVHTHARNAHSH